MYLDETFINKNYSGSDLSWYCDDWKDEPALDKSYGPYINKPSGKGNRLIILNAVTNAGWIDGAKLVFQAKSNRGDYHGSMDEHNFTKWFTEQLLPNIPDDAVIIMDNAPYHNTYMEDGVPPLTSKKIVLQQWLSEKKIAFREDFLRPQLIELINEHRPSKVYKLDDMLKNNPKYRSRGIEILRTPQYHPELQPIEKCWAVMKQYMAKHCDFTLVTSHLIRYRFYGVYSHLTETDYRVCNPRYLVALTRGSVPSKRYQYLHLESQIPETTY